MGGARSSDDRLWHHSENNFYVPVEALSVIFRAKFKDEMKKAGLFEQTPAEVCQIACNVNLQAVSESEALSRISFRMSSG
jgi:Putative transposase